MTKYRFHCPRFSSSNGCPLSIFTKDTCWCSMSSKFPAPLLHSKRTNRVCKLKSFRFVTNLFEMCHKSVSCLSHIFCKLLACVSSSGLAFKHLLSIQILRTTSYDDISKHLKGRSLSRVSVSRFRTRDFVLFLFLDTFQKKSQLFFLNPPLQYSKSL